MYTVLVVDDDPAIREIFTAFLQQRGFTAIAVSGGRECLDLLEIRTPDIILLDLMMEPMDGWETLREIRHHPRAGLVPVMIITGKLPVPADILQYGGLIEDFIGKPLEFGELVACLPRTLEKIRDLNQAAAQRQEAGMDPARIAEYTRLLRLVRLTNTLIRRHKDKSWAERVFLEKQEERLASLHALLGFPDRFLAWDEKG
ncbi:MAG TPA: response regulator [Methanoregulaceae archaeon]|nr:response regulator [Methanoregulaceae archaeon]